MKMKQLIIAGFLALCGSAFGSVTLSFSVEAADNFANSAGIATDGMYYGVLIDTTNNGFTGTYSPVTLATNGVYTLNNALATATDDVLVLAGFQTYSDVNSGTIYDCGPFDLAGGVTASDVFRLVWIDGNNIGVLADASFTIPADGSLQDYTAPFVGTDPIRSAVYSYSGTSATPTGPGFTFVPEPSAALLGAIGALGLLRRRRN